MKKVVIKETENNLIILDIMLYVVFVVVGFILLNFSDIELLNPMEYASPLFYMFGFFSLLIYFFNRSNRDYELLIFGFINVCIASFILVFQTFPNTGLILSDAILVYSICNVINKGYSCKTLIKNKDLNFFPKVSITILLLFLGVFIVSSLYLNSEVGSLILGYYFAIFGLLSLFEPLMSILIKNVKFETHMLKLLNYEAKEEKKVMKPRELKKETIKRISKKRVSRKKA